MMVAAAPKKALIDKAYFPRNENAPNNIPNVAKAQAPDETPRMNGSASLFLTNACIDTPVTANDPPTIIPSKTLGRRRFITMFSSNFPQST